MKNAITYYYNLNIDYVHFYRQKYYFKHHYNDYVLITYDRSIEELEAIYELNKEVLMKDKRFHQIILNKDMRLVTSIDGINYILLKIGENSSKLIEIEDIESVKIMCTKKMEILNRFSWTYLWSQKIDYIEYQAQHFESEYPSQTENIWYFIGMAENAISYIQNAKLEEIGNNQDSLCVAHRRINTNEETFDYYNPISLILDHPTRDISEFLKSYFQNEFYDMQKVESYFEKVSLSKFGYRILLGRMLFPSFYFDNYQKMVDHELSEKEVVLINSRMKEYELYVLELYSIFKKYADIPSIDWIVKKTY